MDDLTRSLTDLFRRYQVEFSRIPQMSDAAAEQVTKPFRREVSALIAEHGREAVVRAALLLSAPRPTLN